MSFYNNFQSDRFPGCINGNPMNGLCEKVCLQAQKVFDACMRQTTEENVALTVNSYTPENPTVPLTFLSAKSVGGTGTVTNLTVDRLEERPKFARIRATVTAPIEVLYTDDNGTEGKATGNISVPVDVILHVPEASVIPYQIEAVVGAVCPEGTYSGTNTFTLTVCMTLILKVTVQVELLVPSYGYCPIPPCQEYNQEICSTYFELPLYPGCSPT